MEKKHIVKFLNQNKKGAYTLLVEIYSDLITSMATTMALQIIQEDLEKESVERVNLNYNSLARAVARSKKKSESKRQAGFWKREFKDTNELMDNQMAPGKFKIEN